MPPNLIKWLVLLTLCFSVPVCAQSINFEELGAQPAEFIDANPLRLQYAGLSFTGPGALDGGAILNLNAEFGIEPRSGTHYFAFNTDPGLPSMLNGGFPRDPEQITFSVLVDAFQIYASGGDNAATFRLDAFADGGALVGTTTITSAIGQWSLLAITGAAIRQVQLTQVNGDGSFVYDDLSYHSIPAPTSMLALIAGGALVISRRHPPTR